MELDQYAENLKTKLSRGNFDGSHLPSPVDNTPWPQTSSPLYFEVGCGAGLHPVLFGKKFPERHLIACERTKEKFEKFKRRVEHQAITNVTPIFEDALHWLYPHKELAHELFAGVYILYPNPYPKNSQRNKRFFAAPSFQFLLSTLRKDGLIELRSNETFYIEEAIFLAKEVWNLEVVAHTKVSELKECEQGVTHFERKYLKTGQNCMRVIFRKKKDELIASDCF